MRDIVVVETQALTWTSGPTTLPRTIEDAGASFASALYTIAEGSQMNPASYKAISFRAGKKREENIRQEEKGSSSRREWRICVRIWLLHL